MDFWKKLVKAYKDSQIWNKIETSEDLKQAYKDSYEKPVALLTCATMHFRSDYMISDFEKQARRMDLSRVKFYRLNYTGNSTHFPFPQQKLSFFHFERLYVFPIPLNRRGRNT